MKLVGIMFCASKLPAVIADEKIMVKALAGKSFSFAMDSRFIRVVPGRTQSNGSPILFEL
jgi:hypothetical protein